MKIKKDTIFKIKENIAFYPSLIILAFFVLSILVLLLDLSDFGDSLKKSYPFLVIGDASTARAILSALIAGIISITVFSFSMVMVVMNQTASFFSQKLPHRYVEETPPQIVLGVHIGSIIFSLVLLFRVHENEGALDIPSVGIFLSIGIGIINILLFIYFINYISHSIELYTIVEKVYKKTVKKINQLADDREEVKEVEVNKAEIMWYEYEALQSGFYQSLQHRALIKLARENDIIIKMNVAFGEYVVSQTPLFALNRKLPAKSPVITEINSLISYHIRERIDENLFFGFRQVSEIAVRAMSPGLNDPSTAKFCVEFLQDLFAKYMKKAHNNVFYDEQNDVRLITKTLAFTELFYMAMGPIRLYGKADTIIIEALLEMLRKLAYLDMKEKKHAKFFNDYLESLLSETNDTIPNPFDQNVIKRKVFELIALDYFTINNKYL